MSKPIRYAVQMSILFAGMTLLTGCAYFDSASIDSVEMQPGVQQQQPADGAVTTPPATDANQTEPNSDQSTTDLSNTGGSFVDYSDTAVAAATQNGGRAVLFFHAAWCPTCQAAEKDIRSKSGQIPNDLTIIKVDYDTMSALKDQYGITYQHTFVQVDAEGNEITKWNGGNLSEIIDRTK